MSDMAIGSADGSTVQPIEAKRTGGAQDNVCEHCGNRYDKAFRVVQNGRSHVFDSFECAIHALAPTCAHCGCRIVGHGVEARGTFYCCAHCAGEQGVHAVQDRV